MRGQSVSIDRREAYYERAAPLIAKDPLGFYTRAEHGRRVQAGIKPQDLKPIPAGVNVSQLIREARAAGMGMFVAQLEVEEEMRKCAK